MSTVRIPRPSNTTPDQERAYTYLDQVLNNFSIQGNLSATGQTPAPQPHSSISVKGGAGIVDVKLTDNSPQYGQVQHAFDYSGDGGQTWHQKDMGTSLNWRGALGLDNVTVRSYTRYPTSGTSSYLYHPSVDTTGDSVPEQQPGGASVTSLYTTPTPPKRA